MITSVATHILNKSCDDFLQSDGRIRSSINIINSNLSLKKKKQQCASSALGAKFIPYSNHEKPFQTELSPIQV